ncbi:hypothetical protein ACN68I_03260 [Aerococcus viridans]|uniref:hypothetical protein n=1 Tax=Aerococcus viridans TaxID=1377 RepID=UPI003B2238B8
MKQLKELPQRHRQILAYIPNGSQTMVTRVELVKLSGLNDRDVYQILNDLTMKYDIPIGSSRDRKHFGYYIPMNEQEKIQGIRSLEEQGYTMLKRAEKVRNSDIQTAQAYKEKYKLTPANIPVQTTLQYNYERSITPLN